MIHRLLLHYRWWIPIALPKRPRHYEERIDPIYAPHWIVATVQWPLAVVMCKESLEDDDAADVAVTAAAAAWITIAARVVSRMVKGLSPLRTQTRTQQARRRIRRG